MRISIIIATWNAGKTLQRCLESITGQLTRDCELLLIDGGSTDSTNEIIASFHQYVSYTVSERDNGIYDAWNKGIKASTGDWIMFVGADDVLLPTALGSYLEEVSKADNCGVDYICAHNQYLDSDGKVIKRIGAAPEWSVMRRRMAPAHVASLHSRKLFDEIGMYDTRYRICADYELLVRKGDNLVWRYLPYTIASMETGGASFSPKAIKEAYQIRKQHRTIPSVVNCGLYLRDYLLFKLFILRYRILGYHIDNK